MWKVGKKCGKIPQNVVEHFGEYIVNDMWKFLVCLRRGGIILIHAKLLHFVVEGLSVDG